MTSESLNAYYKVINTSRALDGVVHSADESPSGLYVQRRGSERRRLCFSSGAASCANPIPELAGANEAQHPPPSDPAPQSEGHARPAAREATPGHKRRGQANTPIAEERGAPASSGHGHAWSQGHRRGVRKLPASCSIIPRTHNPHTPKTKVRGRWQSIALAALGAPSPTHRAAGELWGTRRGTALSRSKRGRAPTRDQPRESRNRHHCAKRTQREVKAAAPGATASAGRRTGLTQQGETERSSHLPHGGVGGSMTAQPERGRRPIGTAKRMQRERRASDSQTGELGLRRTDFSGHGGDAATRRGMKTSYSAAFLRGEARRG